MPTYRFESSAPGGKLKEHAEQIGEWKRNLETTEA